LLFNTLKGKKQNIKTKRGMGGGGKTPTAKTYKKPPPADFSSWECSQRGGQPMVPAAHSLKTF
jgi:hypothetical protein